MKKKGIRQSFREKHIRPPLTREARLRLRDNHVRDLFNKIGTKNPYWSFEFEGGNAGDTVKISWVDNLGETGSGEAQIK